MPARSDPNPSTRASIRLTFHSNSASGTPSSAQVHISPRPRQERRDARAAAEDQRRQDQEVFQPLLNVQWRQLESASLTSLRSRLASSCAPLIGSTEIFSSARTSATARWTAREGPGSAR